MSTGVSRINTRDELSPASSALAQTANVVKNPFRASFSRVSMQDMVPGSPPAFYNDEELEDTVITWAKMLFAFLEFLDNGWYLLSLLVIKDFDLLMSLS